MRALRILTHPYLLMASFLLILISGKHLGGFYALYLLLALPHGGLHALAALAGIALLVYATIRRKREAQAVVALMNGTGVLLLVLSLIIFFGRDREGYNDATFQQTVPQLTLLLFALLACTFFIRNLLLLMRTDKRNRLRD